MHTDIQVVFATKFPQAIIRNDLETIENLQARLLDLNEQTQAVQARADQEGRDLTEDELTQMNALFAEFGAVEEDIERRKRIDNQTAKLKQSFGRQAEPNTPEPQNQAPDPQAQTKPKPRTPHIEFIDREKGKGGFRSFGEFACAVRTSRTGNIDQRLSAAASTYGSESVGADGGYAVPPDFRDTIMEKVVADTSLLSRTDQLTSSSNTMTFPSDDTTDWQSSGGIQAYWEGEAGELTQSKPALKDNSVRLNKITALVPVTEELMEDAPALDAYLKRKAPRKIDFKVGLAILQGSGVGQPLGILNSNACITVAKESGQSADTIVFKNIVGMWTRMYAESRPNAVWLINQDIEAQLMTMSFEGTSSSVPVYIPAGGLSASPYGTLLGRPVLPTQACNTLGDKGDLVLADLNQYLTIMKTGGIRADVSMHLYFDTDTLAYRFILRVGGQPWWGSAVSPRSGSNTVSPFVCLAERA